MKHRSHSEPIGKWQQARLRLFGMNREPQAAHFPAQDGSNKY